jgi:ribosomal 50S subunit-associated protein YjgA (DUF615 family)
MPIDDRIRHLIREELDAIPGAGDDTGLQQQLNDLHQELHAAVTTVKRLEARVDTLEKEGDGAAPTAMRTAPKRTTTRKTGGE